MQIDFANLSYQYQLYKKDIDTRMQAVLDSAHYILGTEVDALEKELAQFTNAQHAVSCSSGADALLLAMMALDIQPGDEIITTPFSFIATAETIALMHAVPVFVDVQESDFNIDVAQIEQAITPRTKAIMPVSLYGQAANIKHISEVAKQHALAVIVDGAQSFGATIDGVSDSTLGDISCTSFFPAKPLGCYGDGGAVFTADAQLAEKMRMLRIHGQNARYQHKYIGMTGRLDALQAAVLRAKLPHYEKEIQARNEVAQAYSDALNGLVITPQVSHSKQSVWAQYTIRTDNRDQLQQYLSDLRIPTAIHYPTPLHLQSCFSYLQYKRGDFPVAEQLAQEVLSLPMNAFLTVEQVSYITQAIDNYFHA